MKVCFVGCGSIGRRHINNLQSVCSDRKNNLEIHLLRSGRKPVEGIYFNKELFSIEELDEEYDAIFITNPTFLHYDTLKQIISYSDSFFVEKPVFDSVEYDYSFVKDNKKIYVACPLRYTGVISSINEFIDVDNIFSVRAICSSYLPDWRPNIDYRQCYSAHTSQGGGVGIDLIHEWDYLTSLFGFPDEVSSLSSKVSELEIDSEDIALYIAKYKNLTLELHLDYFGRVPRRECELYSSEYVYKLDLINNCIIRNGEVVFSTNEDANDKYIREMIHFLDYIEGYKENSNDIDNAIRVMKLAYS